MGVCFPGVPTQNINMFLLNMVMFDASVPHSSTRLSPISFQEYLVRNQILTTNPLAIYNEANKIWRQYISANSIDLSNTQCKTMDMVTEKQSGWNLFIDFLIRFLKVEDIPNSYYQMHYLSHLAHEYVNGLDRSEKEATLLKKATRLFTAILSPTMYEVYIPTTYVWMPFKNYLDIRFDMGIKQAIVNAKDFIRCHSGQIDHRELDRRYKTRFVTEVENLIKGITKVKFQGNSAWYPLFEEFMRTVDIQTVDIQLCELYPIYRKDHLPSSMFIDDVYKLRDKYNAGKFSNDADEFIDNLLDIRSKLKK